MNSALANEQNNIVFTEDELDYIIGKLEEPEEYCNNTFICHLKIGDVLIWDAKVDQLGIWGWRNKWLSVDYGSTFHMIDDVNIGGSKSYRAAKCDMVKAYKQFLYGE